MNQITIAGHLGADPEVRFTSSGKKVTTLRVGARVRKKTKGEDTIWWRVTIWGENFEGMIMHLKKGSPIIVMGEVDKPEIFVDREGKPQVSTNITAQNLLFSPFGRPDSVRESDSVKEEFGGASPSKKQPSHKQFEQKNESSAGFEEESESFEEEGIPF